MHYKVLTIPHLPFSMKYRMVRNKKTNTIQNMEISLFGNRGITEKRNHAPTTDKL